MTFFNNSSNDLKSNNENYKKEYFQNHHEQTDNSLNNNQTGNSVENNNNLELETLDNFDAQHVIRLLSIKSYHNQMKETFKQGKVIFGTLILEPYQKHAIPMIELLKIEFETPHTKDMVAKLENVKLSTINRLTKDVKNLSPEEKNKNGDERIQHKKLKEFLDAVAKVLDEYTVLKQFDDNFVFDSEKIKRLR